MLKICSYSILPESTDRRIVKAALGIILLSALVVPALLSPSSIHLVDCGFLNITGQPCPSCGITRSFHAIALGDISQAFQYNYFGPVLYLLILLLSIKLLVEAASGRKMRFSTKRKTTFYFIVSMLGVWLVLWLVRLMFG